MSYGSRNCQVPGVCRPKPRTTTKKRPAKNASCHRMRKKSLLSFWQTVLFLEDCKMSRKTFSTSIDVEQYQHLRSYLFARNISITDWLDEQMARTLTPKEELEEQAICPLDSAYIDKKNWMMQNLSNTDQIHTIKAGCEEWLGLIRSWNRGDLQDELYKRRLQNELCT